MTGALLVAITSQNVLSDTCETSTIIPNRFISRTTCFAKTGKPVVVGYGTITEVAGGISPLVGVAPSKRHISDAKAVKIPEQAKVTFNRVSTFNAHEYCQFVLHVRALDIIRRKRHRDPVWVTFCLRINRID